ncbi:AAA family ATPase [Halobacillus rhizosphaerae]|uniref:AAA family ATPase n=1 Tax=Halobacillus rhizosphaerae TaxID=3064889 RepID=UPI00398B5ED9
MEVRIRPTRTLFFSEENFFGIYGAEVHNDDLNKGVKLNRYDNISIKGVMPKLNHGEEYVVVLKEEENSKYEGSYVVESIRQDKPTSIEDQRAFLEAILTPLQVENIFNVYDEGQDIVSMIENNEFDFMAVKGLGEKSFVKLRDKVMENVDMSEVLAFLSKYGIKYNMISKLVKEYKNPQIVIQKIEENPYILTEVKGVGFVKADEIAKAVGYDLESPHRLDSCFQYIVGEENSNGHSWIGYKQLLNKAIDLLNINKSLIEDRLDGKAVDLIRDNNRYTTKRVYKAEEFVAMKMTQFKTQSTKLFEDEEIDTFLQEYCAEHEVELEENQRKFFYDWNENNILMLVGGGGMGKSWLQRILLELIDKKNLRTALLAPTGKASKVMQGYTGRHASTIHRKAGVYDSDEEGKGEIWEDCIIIDESSMCDIFILQNFFLALVNTNARILFVGDDFQLPSVGVGNFLYDIIHSQHIKVSKLKKVFRQADGGILNVATDVREGKKFLNDTDDGRIQFGRDCVFWLTDQDYVSDGIYVNYKNVLKKFDQDDVVILSPTKKGKLGTVEINKEVQKIANPSSPHKKEKAFGRDNQIIFRVGDSVMNTVNTYDIDTTEGGIANVYNGDTGKIVDIDEKEKFIIVNFEGIEVKMKFEQVLQTLLHSWAMTIHKSQGSQFRVVILVLDKSMKYQLNANLIYTGISRAKDYMLGLGQAEAINHGISKFANMERRSFLQEFLNVYNGEFEFDK